MKRMPIAQARLYLTAYLKGCEIAPTLLQRAMAALDVQIKRQQQRQARQRYNAECDELRRRLEQQPDRPVKTT